MKKNSLRKSTQMRASKTFKALIKNFPSSKKDEQVLISPTKKVRNSMKVNTVRSIKSTTKKTENNTSKKINEKVRDSKRKSTVKKHDTKITKSKLNSRTSLVSNKSNKSALKTSKNLNNKSKNDTKRLKKEESNLDNDMKINSKDSKISKNYKTSDIRSSEGFNSINDENEINSNNNNINNYENDKLNNNPLNENEKNMEEEKSNHNSQNQSKRITNIPIPIKNDIINKKPENEYNNLIKDSNDKINGIYPPENENIENDEKTRLRNPKIEKSDYITEKNKNMIRNLLFLLDKKSDDKKAEKNIFRSSVNALEKSERNKLLETLYKNRREIFKIKWDEEAKNISQSKANKKMEQIYSFVFEPKSKGRNDINDINNINSLSPLKNPNQGYYHNKFFLNYASGTTQSPNPYFYERNNLFGGFNNENKNQKLNHSYEPKFHVMKKNDLIVENRDKRYLQYNYGYMINTINNKLYGNISTNDFSQSFRRNNNNSMYCLNKSYRDINRNRRIQNLFNSINASINSLNSLTYYNKNENYDYNLRNSIY